MTTYRERFDKVIQSGHYHGAEKKVAALAQLIFANDRSQDKEDCVVQALEEYEGMTGCWWDPTHEEYDALIASIL